MRLSFFPSTTDDPELKETLPSVLRGTQLEAEIQAGQVQSNGREINNEALKTNRQQRQ
jgi:hypothetical protein